MKKISNIKNIDLYILSLSKSNIIVDEKKQWLKKYAPFIKDQNYIIINKEIGEYDSQNRDYIKAQKIEEKMKDYDYVILLDDDHKILKETRKNNGQ